MHLSWRVNDPNKTKIGKIVAIVAFIEYIEKPVREEEVVQRLATSHL